MIRSKFLQQIKYQKTAGTAFAKGGAGSDTDVGVQVDIEGAKEYLKVTGATTSAVVLGDFGEDAPDSSVVL